MPNFDLFKSLIAGWVRLALMFLFGNLIAKGYVSENNVLLASGVIGGLLLTLASNIWRKIKMKYRLEAALELPPSSTQEEVRRLADEKLAQVSSITKVLP